MKTIICNDKEFEQIKTNQQLFKVFNNNFLFHFLEECKLKNILTNEILKIQITSINNYTNLDDALKIINLSKFGPYTSREEFTNFINKEYDMSSDFVVCRIKNLEYSKISFDDPNLIKLIDMDSVKNINIGLSGCQVFEVKLKDVKNQLAILKIQLISGDDTLKEEYDILKYLNNVINISTPRYYNCLDNKEYLLRDYIDGELLMNCKNFGFKLGTELKKLHSLYDENCQFNKFRTDKLLANALKNIDGVYQSRGEIFNNYSKEELIKFLVDNTPENDALIHGDFSLTNIINKNNEYYYIDLGNMSISTKYFDIYVLHKSLIINDLLDEYQDFLNGYGIKEVDDVYLNWMSLIELSYN